VTCRGVMHWVLTLVWGDGGNPLSANSGSAGFGPRFDVLGFWEGSSGVASLTNSIAFSRVVRYIQLELQNWRTQLYDIGNGY